MIRITDIFDRLGGVTVVRDITGHPYQTCMSWMKRNGSIPQHLHPQIVNYAKSNGLNVTHELLATAAANEHKIKSEADVAAKADHQVAI